MHPEGFEPPTLGSEDRCSVQLSYECLPKVYPAIGSRATGSYVLTLLSLLTFRAPSWPLPSLGLHLPQRQIQARQGLKIKRLLVHGDRPIQIPLLLGDQ